MMDIKGAVTARLPEAARFGLKRMRFGLQIRAGKFLTGEPEFGILHQLVEPGDWVLDVGANVGHYSARLSELVGSDGRVIAFEPVQETFALLTSNMMKTAFPNVTCLNLASSDEARLVAMSLPSTAGGSVNFYRASIVTSSDGEGSSAIAVPVDGIGIQNRIALIKVDVEGHERPAIDGMRGLISRDKPILIIETESSELETEINGMGYKSERMSGSPNILFQPI